MTTTKRYASMLIILLMAALMMSSAACTVSAADHAKDGEYAIEVTMTGGSGKASVQSPTLLTVTGGKYQARLIWSSPNYDYMIVEGKKYLNEAEKDANSVFTIPVSEMDKEVTVIADTTAMGTPHEIEYKLTFYSDSVADKSTLPQEGAKRVVMLAGAIIVLGAIASHFTNKRRNRDYEG